MGYAFAIEPDTYHAFADETALIEKCKEWGLLTEKASKAKAFFYKRKGMSLACSIVGFVDQMTAVIEFENKQRHCIHPSYLKEMQAANYGQKLASAAEEATVSASAAAEPAESEAAANSETQAPAAAAAKDEEPASDASLGEASQLEAAAIVEPADAEPAAEAPAKGKAKKEKAAKLVLPEGKVTMTATVQEFTTVPNHFSDSDDEVIIYEAVSIAEPAAEVGLAWSSHSATLKKLELNVGDTITFEGKIVAKKLTKHPVPYKINNPAKIQKEGQ
ncbi:hypothetical protein ACHHV8_07285 [Paenibacillus sp. TAB 01]|uniref:hypothetical protein n=1 Tax=Paenibacillus sp. TAB 01 TaxID=3368988 RepID=UPI003750877F